MLEILGRVSSINVRKVLWTADELGLDYRREDWGMGFRATSEPEFTALNPNALVPVIRDGDFVLWESNTICRYLAGSRGSDDLLPTEPARRARVEQWMDWMATDVDRVSRYPFLALTRNMPPNPEKARLDADIAAWNRCMGILDRQLESTGAFVAGDRFTLADINVGLAMNRWLKTPIERPESAALAAYRERLLQRPAFVRWAEEGPA